MVPRLLKVLDKYKPGDLVLISEYFSETACKKNGGLISMIVSDFVDYHDVLAIDDCDIDSFEDVTLYEIWYNGDVHFITRIDILGKII